MKFNDFFLDDFSIFQDINLSQLDKFISIRWIKSYIGGSYEV